MAAADPHKYTAYPEYPSGANSLTGAITRMLERFFGNKMTFQVTSVFVNPPQTKTYQRFSIVADDVVNVRIYQGIHFRSADVVARRHGTQIADMASATSCDGFTIVMTTMIGDCG